MPGELQLVVPVVGRGARLRPRVSNLTFGVVAGMASGCAAAFLVGLTTRWLVYVLAAVLFGTVMLIVPDRRRLLWATFILSLQVSAAYRVGFGQAGSAGLAFPLSAVVGAGLLGWIVLSGELRERGRNVRWFGSLRWPIVWIAGTCLMSLALTSERFVGLAQLLFQIELYLVFWLTLNLIRSEADLDRTVRLLLVALACQSVVYLIESAVGKTFTGEGDIITLSAEVPRPGGTVSTNPAGFASFVIPILCVAITRLGTLSTRWWLRVAMIAMGVTAIGLTFTRAAWVGLAVALLWLAILGIHRGMLRVRWVLPVALFMAVVGLVLAPGMVVRETTEGDLASAFHERWGLMMIAGNVIAHHPLVGIGPGAYDQVFKEYVSAEYSNQWLAGVHNEFLKHAAETGIAGGAAFVAFMLMGLRQAVRLSRAASPLVRTTALGWSAGLAYLIWQMSWVPWDGFEYNALMWLMLGLTEASALLNGAVPSADNRRLTTIGAGAGDSLKQRGVHG